MTLEKKADEIQQLVKSLCDSQRYAILSTHEKGSPHATLVAFLRSDIWSILFATTKSTRKFHQITEDPHVALLIDNRKNQSEDIGDAVTVEARGTAIVLNQQEKTAALSKYLKKHPHLANFLHSPQIAIVKIEVERYDVVQYFQQVTEWVKS